MARCIKCNVSRAPGRRMCPDCFGQFKRDKQNALYKLNGRWKIALQCPLCNKTYSAFNSDKMVCTPCRARKPKLDSTYVYSEKGCGRLIWQHRVIAEELLGRILDSSEHVHHLDGSGVNNSLDNLVILSSEDHARLHSNINIWYLSILCDRKDDAYFFAHLREWSLEYIDTMCGSGIKLWLCGGG